MTLYALILFLHLTGTVALFLAFGVEWAAVSFLGGAVTADETKTWLRLARLSPLINGPALLVVLLTGGYLASLTGAMKQGWIPATFLGIAVIILLGIVVNVSRLRAIRVSASEGGEKLTQALRNKALPVSVRLRVFLALGIVFLMTGKLPFGQSLLALLVALVIGLLVSIPVLLRKPA